MIVDAATKLIMPSYEPSAAQEVDLAPQRNIFIIAGPPGAGKGTHSATICDTLGITHLSTGDMLRHAVAAGTALGKQVEGVMAAGDLVSDDLVVGVITERVQQDDCSSGFLLDGFPRTQVQAEALDAMLETAGESVTGMIVLDVDDDKLTERICGRWTHEASGRLYHTKFDPPKSAQPKVDAGEIPDASDMLDDETSEALMQRPDDTAEKLVPRLGKYHESTEPVLEYYSARDPSVVKRLDGNHDMPTVGKLVLSALGELAEELDPTSPRSTESGGTTSPRLAQVWVSANRTDRLVQSVRTPKAKVKYVKKACAEQLGLNGVVKAYKRWEELEVRGGSRAPFHTLPDHEYLESDPTVVYKVGYAHQFSAWVGAVSVLGEDSLISLSEDDFVTLMQSKEMQAYLPVSMLPKGVETMQSLRRIFDSIDVENNDVIQEYLLRSTFMYNQEKVRISGSAHVS